MPEPLKEGQKYPISNEFLPKKGKGISISDTMNVQHFHVAKALFQKLSTEATKMGGNFNNMAGPCMQNVKSAINKHELKECKNLSVLQ